MNVFLIGYRCTGKTTVGRTLSIRFGWPFLDTDTEVVRENGMSIADLVANYGWDCFRKQERGVLQRICREKEQVVATGGGIVLNPLNISDMGDAGKVVWLKAGPTTIAHRMGRDSRTEAQRPSLTGKTPVEEIEETLMPRLPLYEKAMHFAVDTETISIEEVAERIVSNLTASHPETLKIL